MLMFLPAWLGTHHNHKELTTTLDSVGRSGVGQRHFLILISDSDDSKSHGPTHRITALDNVCYIVQYCMVGI